MDCLSHNHGSNCPQIFHAPHSTAPYALPSLPCAALQPHRSSPPPLGRPKRCPHRGDQIKPVQIQTRRLSPWHLSPADQRPAKIAEHNQVQSKDFPPPEPRPSW